MKTPTGCTFEEASKYEARQARRYARAYQYLAQRNGKRNTLYYLRACYASHTRYALIYGAAANQQGVAYATMLLEHS